MRGPSRGNRPGVGVPVPVDVSGWLPRRDPGGPLGRERALVEVDPLPSDIERLVTGGLFSCTSPLGKVRVGESRKPDTAGECGDEQSLVDV